MFSKTIAKNERFRVVANRRYGLHLLLVDSQDLGRGVPFTPLWFRQIGDERSMRALSRWLNVRRGRWQAWGELARRIGYPAFDKFISDLLAAEPAEEVLDLFLTFTPDPRVIVLGNQVRGASGLRHDALYRHRFPSEKAGARFRSWFLTDNHSDYLGAFVDTGFALGARELGRVLNKLSRLSVAAPASF